MSSPTESTDEPSLDVPDHSKREYLLAQIRQKDAIIESLLKQVCCSSSAAHEPVDLISLIAAQSLLGDTSFDRIVPDGHIPI